MAGFSLFIQYLSRVNLVSLSSVLTRSITVKIISLHLQAHAKIAVSILSSFMLQ